MEIIIVGGGAAGFFTALNIAEKHPDYRITILEKSSNVLGKVKVSGGGRCNVTNARDKSSELVQFYPRGSKKLYSTFKSFSTSDMVNWLQKRGVPTKVEDDLRMFPVTDSSQTIIDCFLKEAKRLGIQIQMNCGLSQLSRREKWVVQTHKGEMLADKVILATGYSQKVWNMLTGMGLNLITPVPSLFTFNIQDVRLKNLQGISFDLVKVKISKSKLMADGPLLITHWGLSGPAILKLSSWGARELFETKYQFEIIANFLGEIKSGEARNQLLNYQAQHPKRKVVNYPLWNISKRFWERITNYCGIQEAMIFGELSKKQINKLIEELTQATYEVKGKSTFKEEFVTAGGVALSEINLDTFEAKRFSGLYLAGEVLDIDALTGGFNFQACWSAGWVISENI